MATATPKPTVKMRASAQGLSHSRVDVTVRDLTFSIDEPVERHGTNTGPAPVETALAALIGCTNVIGHKCAGKLQVDIGLLSISVVCDFDRRGVTLTEEVAVPFQAIALTVTADGPATQADLNRVATEVAKYCPLSKLFRAAGSTVTETWHKA